MWEISKLKTKVVILQNAEERAKEAEERRNEVEAVDRADKLEKDLSTLKAEIDQERSTKNALQKSMVRLEAIEAANSACTKLVEEKNLEIVKLNAEKTILETEKALLIEELEKKNRKDEEHLQLSRASEEQGQEIGRSARELLLKRKWKTAAQAEQGGQDLRPEDREPQRVPTEKLAQSRIKKTEIYRRTMMKIVR